jgi:hypothetical protein
VERISYWALFWNWIERRILRRPVARLVPRHPRWADFVRKVDADGGTPIVPFTVAANLDRQLNAVTPWHMRVSIRAGARGTAVRTRSWRWFQWSSSVIGDVADDEAAIESQLLNILLSVQWFICNCTKRGWPSATPLPASPSDHSRANLQRHALELDAVVPDAEVSIANGEATLWWEHKGQIILALDPIPLGHLTAK